jgi:hypothetical protein
VRICGPHHPNHLKGRTDARNYQHHGGFSFSHFSPAMEAPSIVIPEILHQIVDYVVEYEPFLSGRRHKRLQLQSAATLVALASTSRIFSEIAVRTIWESIPHLGVVLALIPEDARQIQIELPSESLLTEYTLVRSSSIFFRRHSGSSILRR